MALRTKGMQAEILRVPAAMITWADHFEFGKSKAIAFLDTCSTPTV